MTAEPSQTVRRIADHGTLSRYVQGKCRCEPCRSTAVRYNKKLRSDRYQGRERLVDAESIRAHVAHLQQQGMSFRAISQAAGWASRNALATALSRTRVRRDTAERILAVQPTSDIRPTRYTDATGARRRLQALASIGWPSRQLAHALGQKDPSLVQRIQSGKATSIRQGTAQAIADLYNKLWNHQGPSQRTRSAAQARGWLPPLAWDDDNLDNPHAQPDTGAVRTTKRSTLNLEDLHELLRWGHTRDEAAARLGTSREAIDKALSRERATTTKYPARQQPHRRTA